MSGARRSAAYEMNAAAFIVILATAFAAEELKNHAPEKRQDDGYVLFGGWKPIKPGNPFYHGSQTGKYHDILSAIPETLDTSSTFYSSSLPSYNKDIYSYYPRPAIKPSHKAKAPVYMETYKRKRPQKGSQGGNHPLLQTLNVPGLNLQHIKGLHDAILSAHHIPLSNLQQGKNVRFLELAIQPLQDFSGFESHSGSRPKGKSGYSSGGGRNSGAHVSPLKVEYIPTPVAAINAKHALSYSLPKGLPVVPLQVPPKGISVVPLQVPPVEEVIDVKKLQIVEVPVPAVLPLQPQNHPRVKSHSHRGYGKRRSPVPRRDQLGSHSPKHQQLRSVAYMQPQIKYEQTYAAAVPQEQPKSDYGKSSQQPQIAAELITINDDHLKELLKTIQIVDKNSKEILRYLPLNEAKKQKDGDFHLLVALPHPESQGGKQESYGGRDHSSGQNQENYHQMEYQIVNEPQVNDYGSKEHSGGSPQQYQIVEIEEPRGHYQVDDGQYGQQHQQQPEQMQYSDEKNPGYDHQALYNQQGGQQQQGAYEGESHYQQHQQGAYEGEGHHQQQQQGAYEDEGHHQQQQQQHQGAYEGEGRHQQQQGGYEAENQGNDYGHQPKIVGYQTDGRGQAYIQVNTQIDEDGYKREPVLAVELKHGQTVEDAIKALDPETLQRLGAHTKDGVEIEVVEIPVDDYASESKKQETVLPSNTNSTTTEPEKKTETKQKS